MTAALRMQVPRALLEEVSTRVLRESALVCARLLPRAPRPLSRWEAMGARLNFSGSLRGQVEAWIPRPLAAHLAENLLGCGTEEGERNPGLAMTGAAEPVSDETRLCAMRELLGILCSSFLSAMGGCETEVRLGRATRCASLEPLRGGGRARELWLEVEGEPMLLRLRLTASSAPAV